MSIRPIGAGALHVSRAYGVGVGAPLPAAAARRLVAGVVDARVDFGSAVALPPAPTPPASAFRLYTRAADVNEVATGVALGRSIDVSG